jgi:hypothetical protein
MRLVGMTHGRDNREHQLDDTYRTMDRMAGEQPSDGLESPMVFGLWVLGLFGIGAAAFVLSAMVAAH